MATKSPTSPAEAAAMPPRMRGVVEPQLRKRRVRAPSPMSPDLAGTSPTGSFGDFVYNGGPVINTPQLYALFIGDWTSAANQTRAARLGQFVTDMMNSRYMNILSQYGCGTSGNLVSSVFIANNNHALSAADIHAFVQGAIDAFQVAEPGPSTAYVLFLDDATGVNDSGAGAVMCEASSDTAFGYHDFFTTTAGHSAFFAVVPGLSDTCLTNSCPDDSSCSLHLAQTQEQRQTQVTSHELSEMFSDPEVGSNEAWTRPGGPHENGDICNGQSGTITVGANTWTVQLMYSKWHDMNTNGATTCIVESANPLPSLLPACSVVLDRSSFGKDEVDALLHLGNPARVDAAFYVVVDGFTPAQLGITAATLVGVPNVAPTVSLTPGVSGMSVSPTALVAEDPTLGGGLQRFTWVYEVDFSSSAGFPTTVGGTTPVTLGASIHATHAPLNSAAGGAVLQLIHEPNPYELDGAVSWLSTDLRVFQIRAGDARFGTTMGNTPASAPGFIQQVMANLNAGNAGGQSFDDLSTDENAAQLELSQQVNGTPVFNFALARVRYRALSNDAAGVRAFFRLFPVATSSTDYNLSTTYRRGGQAGNTVPLLGLQGGEIATIPCFASPRVDTATQNMNAQTDAPNVQTLVHNASGQESYAYFGAWLDINQPSQPRFPITPSPADGPYASGMQTIQQLVRGAHQCLIAEIAFDPDPIAGGATPGSSDKLAQRNLAIVASDNPGSPASHMIPHTFEVRPSALTLSANSQPDELLIDWRSVPHGSEATLYIPGASASHILALANEMYSSHHLSLVDEHTLKCLPRGLSYVPLPSGGGTNLPALVTVNLPATVRKGQAFKVLVRQLTSAVGKAPPPPPPPTIGSGTQRAAQRIATLHWRRVLGSFQLSIPVRTRDALLAPEERLLSVLKWILLAIPADNRWYLVFKRYVGQIGDRVKALGGNPDTIHPSPNGDGQKPPPEREEHCITGRVCEVVFDGNGDFEGFVIDTGCGRKHIKACEPQMAKLVLRACKDRLKLTVCERDEHCGVTRVIVRGCC